VRCAPLDHLSRGTEPLSAAETATSATKAGLHLPSLNGIRTISFALVFLGHAGLNQIVPAGFGVTVFFFLSGYLITTLLRLELQKTGTVSLKNFYLRRILRIFPPFYLVFVLALGAYWIGLLPAPGEPHSIPAVLLHYANYYIVRHDNQGFLMGTGVYWSLAVEEHFYLLFPLLYLFLNRMGTNGRSQALVLLLLCVALLAWRCVLVFAFHASELRTQVASDTRFDSLLFGCALAVYENPGLDRSAISERIWKYGLFPLGIAGLLVGFAIRSDAFRETVRYSLQGLSLIPIFVCAVRYPNWLIMRPLNYGPIAFAGVLSYSLYLIHLIVLNGLAWNLGSRMRPSLQAVLALAITLVLAWLMYEIVEKPCARLRQRLRV
jgi:peptidoglycan/LPS O-acetylase OafA/YrhL